MVFSENDLNQIASKGIDVKTVEQQVDNFRNGFPYVKLVAPAVIGKGVRLLSDDQVKAYAENYNYLSDGYSIMKFVPASGAASRMFKHLFEFMEYIENNGALPTDFGVDKSFNSAWFFFHNIHDFAFSTILNQTLVAKFGHSLDDLLSANDLLPILKAFLTSDGMNYGNLPKGLLFFHKYEDHNRKAIEEHLMEGVLYGVDNQKNVNIHFTVSEEHKAMFENEIQTLKPLYEEKYGLKLNIELSVQKTSTDTIAVDENNELFREADGTLVFRPGGHGALIQNLNDLKKDIVFIKNIDNIVPDSLKDATVLYKKALASILVETSERIYNYLDLLEDAVISDDEIEEVKTMLEDELLIKIEDGFDNLDRIEKIDTLYNMLYRPIRVCGMVKNEGEPGGGPFLVDSEMVSLPQIVEASQIDFANPAQKEIASMATHFNPVDLVCNLMDFHGDYFDLKNFVDESTGFISVKSKSGKVLKAQELPGLWNGAMADWITIFVEVPLETFNPVKTVNDLLRPQHKS